MHVTMYSMSDTDVKLTRVQYTFERRQLFSAVVSKHESTYTGVCNGVVIFRTMQDELKVRRTIQYELLD